MDETGDLVMEGEDTGPSVERFLGQDEYEYFVRVFKGHNDRLLPHVVKEVFGYGGEMNSTRILFLTRTASREVLARPLDSATRFFALTA